jgi:parallel beta-helix repeat protein
MGAGSVLEIADSQATGNFEHGIESWDGAAVVLVNNRCEGNSRNGIHADNAKANAIVEGNQLIANREFGLVLAAAETGHVSKNTASGNLLGGFVIRVACRIPVTGNQLSRNQGPGLTLEKDLDAAAFADNVLSGNTGKQVLTDLVFPQVPAPEPPAKSAR